LSSTAPFWRLTDIGRVHMLVHILMTVAAIFLVSQVSVISTTIYLHRHATHHAVELDPVVGWWFRFCLWLTTGVRRKEWVAVHNKHHAHTDKVGDPHSPLIEGFWHIQLGNVFYYLRAARDPQVIEEYGKSVKEDAWDTLIFNRGTLGLLIGIAILVITLGAWGLVVAAGQLISYVFVLSSSINGIGHTHGYKNYADSDGTNFLPAVPVVGGENLHNNHHRFATSPKFSCRPGEIDPAWPIIEWLVRRGLATRKDTIEEIELRRAS
jgi:stearoyl-CoA desaturase (delta-9 desaturase)